MNVSHVTSYIKRFFSVDCRHLESLASISHLAWYDLELHMDTVNGYISHLDYHEKKHYFQKIIKVRSLCDT